MEIKFKEKMKKKYTSSTPDQTQIDTKKVANFISHLFGCVTILRIQHLQTPSYAQHVALQELYEFIEDAQDKIAEIYQGYNDVIIDGYTTYPIEKYYKMKPVDYVKYICKEVEYAKSIFSDNSAILNIIDELIATLAQTKYKLSKLS